MKGNQLKAYGLNLLLTVALCAAYCLLDGLLGVIPGLLISGLLGSVYYREHYGLCILNSLVVLGILVAFFGPVAALQTGVPLILIGLALALGFRFRLRFGNLMLLCGIIFMADLLFGVQSLKQVTDGTLTLSAVILDAGREMREALFSQFPDSDMQHTIEKLIGQMVDVSIMLMPSVFLIVTTVLAYLQISIFKKMERKKETDVSFLVSFEKIQGSKTFSVIFILLFLILLSAPEGMFLSAAANVVVYTAFIFVVLGMSVYAHRMISRGMKKTAVLILVVALFGLSSTLMLLPVFFFLILGLTDVFFDYRKLRSDENQA